MRTITHTFYYPSRSNTFVLYHLTDLHVGHAACDEAQLRRDIEAIRANPRAVWGGGGDMIDAIARKGDPRYAETAMAAWMQGKPDPIGRQVRYLLEMLQPIADKCLYLLTGNHEDAVLQHADRDVYLEIARGIASASGREIRDIALGWEGFVRLKFRRGEPGNFGGTRTITLYTHHGSGGGRKLGGHALRMEETLLTYDADVVLLGHRHIQQVNKRLTLAPSGNGVKTRERLGVWCGSYLAPYIKDAPDGYPVGNYPQRKHLPPQPTGTVPLLIKPDVRSVLPVISNGNGGELALMMTEAEAVA